MSFTVRSRTQTRFRMNFLEDDGFLHRPLFSPDSFIILALIWWEFFIAKPTWQTAELMFQLLLNKCNRAATGQVSNPSDTQNYKIYSLFQTSHSDPLNLLGKHRARIDWQLNWHPITYAERIKTDELTRRQDPCIFSQVAPLGVDIEWRRSLPETLSNLFRAF